PAARLEMEVRHPDERHPRPAVGAHRPAAAAPDPGGRLARAEEAAEDSFLDDGLARRRDALVVEREAAEPARRRRVRGDVHVLGAVPEGAEVAGGEEARPGVRSLGPVDAVELRRVADGLVHLQLHLLGVDHDRRHLRGALLGAEQGRRLLGDPRGLALEPEALDVLPPGLCARADVAARVRTHLDGSVADRDGLDQASALDRLLVDLDAVRGEEELALAPGADGRLGDLHVRVAERLPGAQAERDLVVERDRERVALDRGAVGAGAGLEGREHERALRGAARCGRETVGAERGVARSLRREAAVGGEAPRPAGEDADADPLGLRVRQRLDAAVLRRHRLRAAHDGARVRVVGAGAEGRVDRRCTGLAHRPRTLPAATMPSARWWRNWYTRKVEGL